MLPNPVHHVSHWLKQTPTERSQLIFNSRGHLGEHLAGDKAISFQIAKCRSKHSLRDPIDHPLKFRKPGPAVRRSCQHQHQKDAPLVPDSREKLPGCLRLFASAHENKGFRRWSYAGTGHGYLNLTYEQECAFFSFTNSQFILSVYLGNYRRIRIIMTRRNTVIYWILTIVVLLPTAGSGIPELFASGSQSVVQIFHTLGYPLYLMKILGFCKIAGALAILIGRYPRIKEWAYAGFTFDFLGAAASHLLAGDTTHALLPFIFFLLLMGSYVYWRKSEAIPQAA